MKKKLVYVAPQTKFSEIDSEELLAGSFQFSEDGNTGTGSLEDEEVTGPGLGKQFNVWDEEF